MIDTFTIEKYIKQKQFEINIKNLYGLKVNYFTFNNAILFLKK